MNKEEATAILIKHRLEQAAMAIADAKRLKASGGSPQSIINRSYYAMFYAALALLLKVGKSAAKHSGVLGLFDTEFTLKGILPKEFSKSFHEIFNLRQEYDYKIVESPSPEKAEQSLDKAVGFVDEVRKYLEARG